MPMYTFSHSLSQHAHSSITIGSAGVGVRSLTGYGIGGFAKASDGYGLGGVAATRAGYGIGG